MAAIRELWSLLRDTYEGFSRDECMSMGASLAFYTLFSLPAVLIIVITVTGVFIGSGQAKESVLQEVRSQAGPQVAQQMENIQTQQKHGEGTLATLLGIVTVLVGATGVFSQLQLALNRAWGVKPDPKQQVVKTVVLQRVLSFVVVIVIAAVLLVSLTLSTLLSAFGDRFAAWMGQGIPTAVWGGLNAVVSFLILILLFALLFKVLPNGRIVWRDVWVGAAVTAVLFAVGKFALGIYLSRATIASPYGAAGSLALLLVWVYYSSLIFLFGAEFTQVWTRHRGRRVRPSPGAVLVEDCDETGRVSS